MALYGTFNVQIDLPVTANALQVPATMAYIIQQAQLLGGNNTDSKVTLSSVKANSSIAFPQMPGFQLYSFSVQAAVPSNLVSVNSFEQYLAFIIVQFLVSINNQTFPSNVSVALTSAPVSLTSISNPTVPNGNAFNLAIAPGSQHSDLPVFPKRYIL
jgi:hypothetical protein